MEYEEIIIFDDEADDDIDYRNAIRTRPGRGVSRPRSRGRPRSGRPNRRRSVGVGRPRRPRHPQRPENAGPVIREDTGGLSTGVLLQVGAQVLAAIQSLPSPPIATGESGTDLGNFVLYQQALAEHAKRDEQLRTLGQLAGKFFA